ncbi:MAG: prepilin-type N-terminal cleavage/methylation domain-containing protein [Magnetococcales bacterium]|nr:prepilin-type N-terminal cleavage/methylation domain-containing protein [Magnetococcales bacterium]
MLNTSIHRKGDRGFSLIEMVIVIMLLGILGGVLGNLVVPMVNSFILSRLISSTDTVNRIAVKRMALELKHASAVSTTSYPTSDIQFTSDSKTIRYYSSGSNLMRQEDGGTARLMSESISTLQFSSDGNYIQISISNTDVNLLLRTRIYPRNVSLPFM